MSVSYAPRRASSTTGFSEAKKAHIWICPLRGHAGLEQGLADLEAARELVQSGYDVVVSGHTYVARHVELREGGTYINTGDCIRHQMYASLDLERRECLLFEFPGRLVATERED